MHWKTKARIQNAVSRIPSSVSYATYYWLQRKFGGLRKINPQTKFEAAVQTWRLIQELDYDPAGKTFLEIGTGRVPNVPMSFWLMGAKGTVTVDVNPYMRTELIVEVLDFMSRDRERIRKIFGTLLDEQRFNELLSLHDGSNFSLRAFLDLCQINYVSPGDAADTGLTDKSVDFHTSRAVFEHIPASVLKKIIEEGNRVIRDDGLFVHRIDYSDHFSHSDKSISSINFLQYSDPVWDRYAGNRYMYMNRLRHDDFLSILESMGHNILLTRPDVDPRALEQLNSGTLQLDERFRAKSTDVLSISGSWIVSHK
jgi:SAM-dependent methyltransferase